jgi:hypothetical protein
VDVDVDIEMADRHSTTAIVPKEEEEEEERTPKLRGIGLPPAGQAAARPGPGPGFDRVKVEEDESLTQSQSQRTSKGRIFGWSHSDPVPALASVITPQALPTSSPTSHLFTGNGNGNTRPEPAPIHTTQPHAHGGEIVEGILPPRKKVKIQRKIFLFLSLPSFLPSFFYSTIYLFFAHVQFILSALSTLQRPTYMSNLTSSYYSTHRNLVSSRLSFSCISLFR